MLERFHEASRRNDHHTRQHTNVHELSEFRKLYEFMTLGQSVNIAVYIDSGVGDYE